MVRFLVYINNKPKTDDYIFFFVMFIISSILLLGFLIWVLGLVYFDSLAMFIIFLILLLGF